MKNENIATATKMDYKCEKQNSLDDCLLSCNNCYYALFSQGGG